MNFYLILLFVAISTSTSIPPAIFENPTQEVESVRRPWQPSLGSVNEQARASVMQSAAANSAAANQTGSESNEPSPANASQPPIGIGAAIQPAGRELSQLNTSDITNNEPSSAGLQSGEANGTQTKLTDITRVTRTLDRLPNSAGQVWREYDITPYTSRITSTDTPQQAILDWILNETGTEMWFNQPLGILNANRHQLLVYHTPEIHRVVKSIVDRFVKTKGQPQVMELNLVTVAKPNWRATSYTMLQPIEVQTPGVEAWMVSKENAALLLSQLRRRGDFQQHNSGQVTNHDGQPIVLEKTSPVQFVRSLRWVGNQVPGYQPLMTKIDEGYRLTISSLSALDGRTIEATIRCDVDQVERLNNVKVEVPDTAGQTQLMNLQIPQLISWRLHERFRWPNDQVLLLSCGVVANPEPQTGTPLNLPQLFNPNRGRADALLFIEYRGPAASPNTLRSASNARIVPVNPRQ